MVTGPGLSHFPCTSKAGKRNIVDLIGKESVPGQEQILSAALKNVVNEKGGEPGDKVRMTGVYVAASEKVELQHKKAAVAGKGFQKAGS